MVRKKRRIILFIDNCTAHNQIPIMKAMIIKFLPLNMTSKLQPLDQGIINNFKFQYRKLVVRKLPRDIKDKRPLRTDLLETVQMAWKTWDEVLKETIKNFFRKAGFGQQTADDSGDLEEMQMETDDALASPEEWSMVLTATGAEKEVSFQDFLEVDSAVNVCGELTDADIAEVANEEEKEDESGDEEEDDKDGDTHPAPSRKETRQAIETLHRFLESTPNLEEKVFQSIMRLRRFWSEMRRHIDAKRS
ncbi:tigger transposable element-derived protein 4-like [Pomacea canaliculata]|uniref:tigger transposable element-derived protein 4-like n=1 Tax=Pomacea canaliculata TaxID=400727 RepID=UPI000D738459|nr:tigger transposable element-derived protein 4-like [Pomacea canaliculata]